MISFYDKIQRFNSILFNFFNSKFRFLRIKIQMKRIQNVSFTLFSDNCLAGFIYHDLNVKFQTPLINGGINCTDYIKFLSNPEFYLKQDLNFYIGNDKHIWAKIYDINYRFTHYKSKEEALSKWNERKKRINYNNLFIIMSEKKGCTYQNMIDFDQLPYKNKIMLTHKPYPEIKSSYYLKGFEDLDYLGVISDFVPGQFFGKRYYDNFDFFSWLNI